MTFSFIKASFRIFLKSNQELVFKFEMSYEMLRLISPYGIYPVILFLLLWKSWNYLIMTVVHY